MRWREGVFYNYEGYFGKRKSHSDNDTFSPEFDTKKWMWMLMVDKIVKEQNKTPEMVYEMNYIDCLNWLSMWRERDKWVEKMEKERIKKIK